MAMTPLGWDVRVAAGGYQVHVTPTLDSHPHTYDRKCPCRPKTSPVLFRDVSNVIHNAWDGRQ